MNPQEQLNQTLNEIEQIRNEVQAISERFTRRQRTQRISQLLDRITGLEKKVALYKTQIRRGDRYQRRQQLMLNQANQNFNLFRNAFNENIQDIANQQQQDNIQDQPLTVDEILRDIRHQELRILLNKLQDDQQLSISEGYRLYINMKKLNDDLKQKIQKQLDQRMLDTFKEIVDGISQAFEELKTEQMSIPDEDNVIDFDGMRVDTKVVEYLTDANNPQSVQQLIKGLKGMIKRLVNRFVYVNFGLNNFRGLDQDSVYYLIDVVYDNLHEIIKQQEQANADIKQDWIKVFVQSINSTDVNLRNFEVIQLNLRNVIQGDQQDISTFFNQSIGLGKNVEDTFPSVSYNTELIQNNKLLSDLRDFVRYINTRGKQSRDIFPAYDEMVGQSYSPIEWFKMSTLNILSQFFQKFGFLNVESDIMANFQKHITRRQFDIKIPQNIGLQLHERGEETAQEEFLPYVQAAWKGMYSLIEISECFGYLWNNSGIMRRFFLCFELQYDKVNELKCSMSQLVHYFYQIFSNQGIRFQQNWENEEEEVHQDFAILMRMLKSHDYTNYINYWKIFNIDFLTMIRIVMIVCLDSIRVCAYSSRGDALSSVRLVQSGITTQYFTRFSSFFTGGLFDQILYYDKDKNKLEYYGTANVWGISTIAYFTTVVDILCKPWYFIQNSQLWLQYYSDSYIWSFKKFSMIQKFQRNNKEGEEKLLSLGNEHKNIGDFVTQQQTKYYGRFQTTSMFMGQLGTYAYINKGQSLNLRGQQVRGIKDFNISVISKAIHLIRRQFNYMINSVNDVAKLIENQQIIGFRLEMLLKINNIFYVLNQDIEQTQYKVLGSNFRISLNRLGDLTVAEEQHRFIQHIVYRILQLDDVSNIQLQQINDIVDDYDGESNYYESGWSVEDLQSYHINGFIDESVYKSNREKMDIDVEKGKRRRDFYFENVSVQNDYTVQIVKSAMMFYQTRNIIDGKEEQNNFWIQRQVMSKVLHGKKFTQDQQSLLEKIRRNESLGLEQGFVPHEYRKFQCNLFTKIEDLFNYETCGQHLMIYFYVKMGLISEGMLFLPNLKLDQIRDLLTDNILYIRIGEQSFLWKEIIKYEFEEDEGNQNVYLLVQENGEIQETVLFKSKLNESIYIFHYLGHLFVIDKFYLQKMKKQFQNSDLQLILEQKIKGFTFQSNSIIGDQNKLRKNGIDKNKIVDLFNNQFQYDEVFEQQELKQNVDKVLVFYDIETTTQKSVQLDNEFELVPYLIVLQIIIVSQINPQQRIENYKFFLKRYRHEQIIKFEGYNCRQQFINFIKMIYNQQEHDVDKRKVIFLGWNSRRFDSQFVILELMKKFPYDTTLIGTLTNPKNFTLGRNIQFWDAMDMVSPMSLERFCKAMNVQGKFNGDVMFQIQTVDDYFLKGYRQQLIEYCTQDVVAMKNGILKFNMLIVDLLKQIRGESINIDQNYFILQKTVAKLAYKLFTQYLFPPILEPQPVQDMELFRDVTLSYRGGMVNNFVFGMIDVDVQQHFVKYLDYIDINSLYPSVMANAQIPLDYRQQYIPRKIIIDDNSLVKIVPLNLYRISEFDCGQNKFGKQMFGFFAVKVQIKGGLTKTLYPRSWQGNESNYMVVWGSEILLFRQVFKNYKLGILGLYECSSHGRVFACIGQMYEKRMEFKNDPQKKALAEAMKIIMNSCYGRFGMRAYQVKKILHETSLQALTVQQQDQYLQRIVEVSLQSGYQFDQQDFTLSSQTCFNGDSLLNITIMKENSYMPRNFGQRVKFIASFIATQARCRLLASMYKMSEDSNLTIFYCDTDSIVYGVKNQVDDEILKQGKVLKWCDFDSSYQSCLTFGNQLGQMKSEIDQGYKLVKFQVFGPKFYRYQVQKEDNVKWVFKSKGINQKVIREYDEHENNRLNELRQVLFFEKFQAELSASIEQQQIKSDKGRMQIYRFMKTNEICLGRKIGDGISEFLNYTDVFQNQNEFLEFIKKRIQLNKFNLQYEYI